MSPKQQHVWITHIASIETFQQVNPFLDSLLVQSSVSPIAAGFVLWASFISTRNFHLWPWAAKEQFLARRLSACRCHSRRVCARQSYCGKKWAGSETSSEEEEAEGRWLLGGVRACLARRASRTLATVLQFSAWRFLLYRYPRRFWLGDAPWPAKAAGSLDVRPKQVILLPQQRRLSLCQDSNKKVNQ